MESPPEPVKPRMEPGFDAVTGAFSFTGRAIAQRLLAEERRVRTLTNHPQRPGSEDIKVDVAPLQFADRAALVESLRGADVLYNTYWVRFRHGKLSFGDAIANTWAIVRPTLVFGAGDILINNIAWLLRRLPFFLIPGDGGYRVQPVAVEDVAEIATWAAEQSDNVTVDAAGPDTVTYGELVEGIAIAVGRRPRFVYTSPRLTLLAGDLVASRVRDVMLTKEELRGLMDELLVSHEKPRGSRRMDNWLLTNADTLGRTYASELDRHWRSPAKP